MDIPEGWRKTTIGENAELLTGHAFKSNQYTECKEDIRLLRGDNIAQGSLRWRDAKRWATSEACNYERYDLKAGDFVIALDRTWIPAGLKISEVTLADLPCLLVQRVARLRSKPTLDQRLLRQLIGSKVFEQFVKSVQTETAVPHISPRDVREFPVFLPPLPEQKKIAQILSTWDRSIEVVEGLIKNSEAQKKHLMQQLLTGRIRLPGFDGEWQEVVFGNIGYTYGGLSGKSKPDFGKGSPYVPYKNVFGNSAVDLSALDFVRISKDENQNRIGHGDVIFTTSSETPDEVGMSSVVISPKQEIYLNSFCFGFRPNDLNQLHPEFSRYYFRSETFRRKIFPLAQGSTRYNISKRELLKLRLHIPSFEEQKAIAEILSSAEKSQVEHFQTRQQLQIEKSALMQQLLTGKRRVKIDKEADHA